MALPSALLRSSGTVRSPQATVTPAGFSNLHSASVYAVCAAGAAGRGCAVGTLGGAVGAKFWGAGVGACASGLAQALTSATVTRARTTRKRMIPSPEWWAEDPRVMSDRHQIDTEL